MWSRLFLLVLCCTVEREVYSAHSALEEAGRDTARQQQPTSEPLEDELDNQENIMTQLLGDYDKVKTVSSGSDCVCRCIVRPMKRSACDRIHDDDPAQPMRDFYTVETVTQGTDCKKCVCLAPPSAVNPCEGEYRFKKLQEASRDDIKLSAIMDLLEGSLYGMDLLKLHSVTTKLLTRVDNMEKAFSRNFTERVKEKERVKERVKEKDKEKERRVQQRQEKKKKFIDLERSGQKQGAAVYTSKERHYEERYVGGPLKKSQLRDSLEQQQPTRNKTGDQQPIKGKPESKQPVKDKNSMVIRGVTFYKAEEESEGEEGEERRGRGQNSASTLDENVSVDLLISDHFPPTTPPLIQNEQPSTAVPPKPTTRNPVGTQSLPSKNHQPTTFQTTTTETTITEPDTLLSSAGMAPPLDTASVATESALATRSRLSWTESPSDRQRTTKKPGVCKDTVASISEPVQQNSYGRRDGAWMRDARGHGNVIYLTNGHYGNNLLEFRDMDTFKSGQASNSYKLPYSFTGTGHVVFNGGFYYNRAFSGDIIRYDLRHRYVAAWTTLHDAILEEQAQRTSTEVEFAVDESGLWLLYPALDTEGFHQEVILLTQLHPRDLQPIRSFRTGLRRGRYGDSFLVCGVLYAVDNMERLYANVTYAFDTHTLTHTVPTLAFTNMHTHTSQLAYCPLDRKLYAWDNGHQMTYDVIFAY
ncbi:olfactomedin-like protein 2B [Polymixia lowei]